MTIIQLSISGVNGHPCSSGFSFVFSALDNPDCNKWRTPIQHNESKLSRYFNGSELHLRKNGETLDVHACLDKRRSRVEIFNRYANMLNMSDFPTEKRICTRYLADYEIEVRSTGVGEQTQYEKTVMTDFSDEGLNFVTHYPERYSEGQKLCIQILLPENSPERDNNFSGTVAWASDPDISTCGELVQPRVGVMIDDGNISWLLEDDREEIY